MSEYGSYPLLKVDLGDDYVATVELCNGKYNHFNMEMLAGLADAFEALDAFEAFEALDAFGALDEAGGMVRVDGNTRRLVVSRGPSMYFPTPRSPTRITLCVGRPLAIRASATSADFMTSCRPASSGGGVPAPGHRSTG